MYAAKVLAGKGIKGTKVKAVCTITLNVYS